MKRGSLVVAVVLAAGAALDCGGGSENIGVAGGGGSGGGAAGQGGSGGLGGAGGSGGIGGAGGSGGVGGAGGSGGVGGAGGSGGAGGTGGQPGCDSPVAITLPSSATYPIAAGGIVCLSVDLPADQALGIDLPTAVGIKGTALLRAASGDVVASRAFGLGATAKGRLHFGLTQAGTYRVEVTNPDGTSGQVTIAVATIEAEVAGVPDSRSLMVATNKTTTLLVKPDPGTTFAVSVAQDAGATALGMTLQPSGAAASTTGAVVRALANRVGPLVEPLVELSRTTGPATQSVTVSTFVPPALAFDTDLALTTLGPGQPVVLAFDGKPGLLASFGLSDATGAFYSVTVYDPLGTLASGAASQVTPQVRPFALDGPYTVEVTNPSQLPAGTAFNLRFNTVPDPTPIIPTARLDLPGTLALGQVDRFSFDVSKAQILRLLLQTPTALDIDTIITGGDIYSAFVKVEAGQAPRSGQSLALFVQKSAPAILSVYSVGNTPTGTTGSYQVSLEAPPPQALALGQTASDTLEAGGMKTFTLQGIEAGWHVLTWTFQGPPAPGSLQLVVSDVWGPTAPFVNYDRGEIDDLGTFGATAGEEVGKLQAGANTLSVSSRANDARAFSALLARIDDPVDITVGAAASQGTLEPGQRDYFTFPGTADQTYTVKVTASFAGSLRVVRQSAPGFFVLRNYTLASFPQTLAAGVERSATFTIPAGGSFGTGTYVIDIDGDGDASGSYTVSIHEGT